MCGVQTLLQDAGILHGEHQLKLETVDRLSVDRVVSKLVSVMCICVCVGVCVVCMSMCSVAVYITNIIVLITQSRLSVAQTTLSFKYLNTHITPTHAVLIFITKHPFLLIKYNCFKQLLM